MRLYFHVGVPEPLWTAPGSSLFAELERVSEYASLAWHEPETEEQHSIGFDLDADHVVRLRRLAAHLWKHGALPKSHELANDEVLSECLRTRGEGFSGPAFPHLLFHDDATGFYVPRALERPIETQSLGAVGSSLRLLEELEVLPRSIAALTSLQRLELAGNRLRGLPDAVGDLTRLEGLGLADNALEALPETLCRLTRLRGLRLDDNRLTALPEGLSCLVDLQRLHVGGNRLSSLPDWIGSFSKLQELHAAHNQIGALPESVGELRQPRGRSRAIRSRPSKRSGVYEGSRRRTRVS